MISDHALRAAYLAVTLVLVFALALIVGYFA
jgi:hypothetical protein